MDDRGQGAGGADSADALNPGQSPFKQPESWATSYGSGFLVSDARTLPAAPRPNRYDNYQVAQCGTNRAGRDATFAPFCRRAPRLASVRTTECFCPTANLQLRRLRRMLHVPEAMIGAGQRSRRLEAASALILLSPADRRVRRAGRVSSQQVVTGVPSNLETELEGATKGFAI